MIIAYINGKPAYPSTSNDIKIKMENPYIKDGEEKTMEIVFPMDIPANKLAFGALNRMDTSFENEDFENCYLMADNMEVIRGTGTITSVTESEVKMQILSGKNYLRYRSDFDSLFIDTIEYGRVETRHCLLLNGNWGSMTTSIMLQNELTTQGYIGEPGKYAFIPIHDESNDFWCNSIANLYSVWSGSQLSSDGLVMVRAAVQPNLLFVLRRVLLALGYELRSCFFDVAPWNQIYVASARVSLSLKGALPHWTAYKFLDEIRKLFNAVFIFDEKNKKVDIAEFDRAGYNGVVELEPVSEFTSTYDEEGLEYLGSSNLEYQLSSCERSEDVVTKEMRNTFEVREYASMEAITADFAGMSDQAKLTTLFHCPSGWYFASSQRDDGGNILSISLKGCGWLSPLVRREDASTVELNIVPVAMKYSEAIFYYVGKPSGVNWNMFMGGEMTAEALMAHTTCENQPTDDWFGNASAKESEYVTVEDVLVNGESVPSKGNDESTMEVFFVSGVKVNSGTVIGTNRIDSMPVPNITRMAYSVAFTEWRYASQYAELFKASMTLNPVDGISCIGSNHNQGIQIKRNINGNNEVCFKFLYHGKPDPTKLYMVRNRKFICSRIEMDVHDGIISDLKTGYFYEVL